MKAVLTALYAVLAGDTALQAKLAIYGGGPAIFNGLAPHDADMPYLVVSARSVPESSQAADAMSYVVDVYDRSLSAGHALDIAQRIESLLNLTRPQIPGHTCLGIWREFQHLVPEEEPEIQHVHLEFAVRYGREDLFA
jgi:hypothetical protein